MWGFMTSFHDNPANKVRADRWLHARAADEFPRKKERSDGLDSYCKACNAAATAERTARRGPVLAPLVASKVLTT